MMNPKAYTQVNQIIKSMPLKMQEKIPEDLRKTIEYNMDKDYQFKIEDFEKITLLEDTEKILSVLYTDYFATDEERQVILAKEKSFEKQKELEKQKQYPSDFMKNPSNQNTQNIQIEEKDLILKEEKLYIRVFNRIKELFGLQ